jgi:DNA processing protein
MRLERFRKSRGVTVKISENALNVLAAKTYRGIGRAWVVKNLRGNESAERIVSLLRESAKEDRTITQDDFDIVRNQISDSITRMAGLIDGVVAIGDKEFPSYRGNVKSSEQPVVLFYRGDLGLLSRQSKTAAVIGLLTPDEETEVVESEMVSKLVSRGVTIVSGLALGCDTVAHRQALRSEGKTVAILPSPLNEILPSTNKNLAEEIVNKSGLLITEYYERAKSKMELSGRYQERDRLQALFSDCVILAASYAKNDLGLDSGARLAMEYAKNYAIPRAVMYDSQMDVINPKYDLNRQIIREQVGVLVINRGNMDCVVGEIVCNQPQQQANSIEQADLFG